MIGAGIILLSSCSISRYAANTTYPQISEEHSHEGILEECLYSCSAGGPSERRMYVYLPSEYYDTAASYPVYYLLHGARGNELSWIEKGDLLHKIDSTYSTHSSFYLKLKKKQTMQFADPPKLYWIMIGKTDFFYPRMNSYCRYLYCKGYRHEYFVSPGGHQWYNWEEYNNMFMKKLWKSHQSPST